MGTAAQEFVRAHFSTNIIAAEFAKMLTSTNSSDPGTAGDTPRTANDGRQAELALGRGNDVGCSRRRVRLSDRRQARNLGESEQVFEAIPALSLSTALFATLALPP